MRGPRRRNSPKHCNLSSSFSILLFATSNVLAKVTNDFSSYPAGAQKCLYDASDSSGCDGDTVPEMNACLCMTSNFATNSAQCVGQKDSAVLESTYEVMVQHCTDSNTPLSLSKDEWLAAGASASTTTSSMSSTQSVKTSVMTTDGQTVTATATTKPTTAPDSSSGGLSSGAKIGIIAGTSAVGAALVATAAILLLRYRKRRNRRQEEEHPMLSASTQYSGRGGEPGLKEGDASAHPGHLSMAPAELEIATAGWKYGGGQQGPHKRDSWLSQMDAKQYPWSPGGFDTVIQQSLRASSSPPPPPDVFELSAENERPVSTVSQLFGPVEMPAIEIHSPTSPGPQPGPQYLPYRPGS